jgi:hypothetical protein
MPIPHHNMNRAKKGFILLSLFCIAGFLSCRKNITPSWDTQILAPLIKTTLSINNLVTNTSVKANPADSSVTLVYTDSLYSLTLDSLLKIRDTTLVNAFASPLNTTISPGGALPFPPPNGPTQYNTGSVQLTNAILNSGKVLLVVRSYINQPTIYTYGVPNATSGGNQLSITVKVPAAIGNKPGEKDTLCDLSGYTIDFTGPNHNGNNLITTVLGGFVDPNAPGQATIVAGDSIVIDATFHNIIPYYGQGYFGQTSKSIGPKQSAFPLFSKISSGSLNLQNVGVSFTIVNGFGVDARITIPQLTSINARPGGITIPLTASIINNAININRATQTYNPASPVTPSVQTFSLSPTNSNILNWIDNLPTSVGYTIDLTTDPLGNVSGNTDFAFLGQGIKAYLDVTVPLYIAANNLTLADTMPVNFANSSQAEQIKSGTFTLYASNQFPFSADLQIYLLDSHMNIIDSLCTSAETIAAGVKDAYGFVTTPQNSILTLPVSTTQANHLFSTHNLIIVSRFNTGCTTCTPIQYSKIYDTYQLNIKLIGNFDYQVKG